MPKPTDFIVASFLTAYPDNYFCDSLKDILNCQKPKGIDSFYLELKSYIETPQKLNNLRSDYIDIFDHGKEINSPYETSYGPYKGMNKTIDLSDLMGFYKAFGFELGVDDKRRDMADHVSVELEFYALLLMKEAYLKKHNDKEGTEIVLDACKKFLKDHLGRFISAIGNRPAVLQHSFYSKVFEWSAVLVAEECKRLNVTPTPLSYDSLISESEDFNCRFK
ncbi:MAG: hypothetical protein A2Z91_09235 [Deltaproteobacteria bacterium GWA2_38_16]|nr:MAG: hypothetical protein A2Z91_09235 [Deltaproteobacteria bacterium GWA2_38_16]OGQ02520.1 MAG: hypothetical protein A3D19_09495 [Deltaproteobacteria bacterium RIFCSPHIGHO2_02_FULL_38_15]OGQ60241.1 MAG: hypothetical protein A3G92_00675 [Deltaproteobacteria bacterium RIFCSPLOWO2_12_FULL_38_8]